MEPSRHDVIFPPIPQGVRLWDDDDDVELLNLLASWNNKVSLDRTILATGVIAIVGSDLNRKRRRLYSTKEVVRRIAFLKRRYLDFEWFKSIPGIFYDEESNMVKTGHHYLTNLNVETENPKHCKFRRHGEPLYRELQAAFGVCGVGDIHLEWVFAYFNDDDDSKTTMPGLP